MSSKSIIITILSLLPFFSNANAQQLSNKKASKQAKALYNYLMDMSGKKILSGQMSSSWGINEINYIEETTGKQPAINGFDFINNNDNALEVKGAKDWWRSGGIPTIMWHMGAPGLGQGYQSSQKTIDIDSCFKKGTKEYDVFWTELKEKADLLQELKSARVPVLWRPFHELDGHWFWWSKQGPEKFKKLWITMYDYFTKTRKLNNLIWVLCYTEKSDASWYPGANYVDIAGADVYNVGDSTKVEMYQKVKKVVGPVMPIAYHECGTPPDPDACVREGAMWSWWMQWHTNHLTKTDKTYLQKVYNHDLVITKDEVPDIVKEYKRKRKK
ncbi:MAG: glycosyl hydrolase [Pelobium sp.]